MNKNKTDNSFVKEIKTYYLVQTKIKSYKQKMTGYKCLKSKFANIALHLLNMSPKTPSSVWNTYTITLNHNLEYTPLTPFYTPSTPLISKDSEV